MRKILILLTSAIFLFGCVRVDALDYSDNIFYANEGEQIPKSGIDRLAEMETALYGKNFSEQGLLARIERLENTVYKRYYSSYPIEQRLGNLIYNYDYNRQNHATRTGKIKQIVDSINSVFVGVPTGYTPPLSNNYYGGYGNSSSYYGNNGWGYKNKSIGGSSGIHILD